MDRDRTPQNAEGVWTRAFGAPPKAVYYSTSHGVARSLSAPRGLVLTEGVGGLLDRVLRFGYEVEVAPAVVSFESVGLWLGHF